MIRPLHYLFLFALILAACSPIQAQRGQIVSDEQLEKIVVGTTAKPEVLAMVGTPTTKGTFDENRWFYVGEDTKQSGIHHPKTLDRRVVAIIFDDLGVVTDKRVLNLDDGQDVAMNENKTEVLSKELNILQQLIGNVGRFSGKEGAK